MSDKRVEIGLSWSDIYARADAVALQISHFRDRFLEAEENRDYPFHIYGVPRGGIYAAQAVFSVLSRKLSGCFYLSVNSDNADIFVDDIRDSGKTEQFYKERYPTKPFFVLVDKDDGTFLPNTWLQFPWERMQKEEGPEDNIRRLLQFIGEDPDRPGLKDTPARMVRAYAETMTGYKKTPQDLEGLFRSFGDGAQDVDEMVVVKDIPFVSFCEHHWMPFFGKAHIGYIPDQNSRKILGLSKFARVVDHFAQRLQVQERLTGEIAEAFHQHLTPDGVAVVLEAEHTCMSSRGVKKHGTTTITSKMTGVFREQGNKARTEFLSLIGNK